MCLSIMDFGIEQARAWITNANQYIQDYKEKLTELDQAIGDGDHGLNMARGFQEVKRKWMIQIMTILALCLKM
ncbi:hypothetical protein ACI2OX_02430 [Bacillus sp. N9]